MDAVDEDEVDEVVVVATPAVGKTSVSYLVANGEPNVVVPDEMSLVGIL